MTSGFPGCQAGSQRYAYNPPYLSVAPQFLNEMQMANLAASQTATPIAAPQQIPAGISTVQTMPVSAAQQLPGCLPPVALPVSSFAPCTEIDAQKLPNLFYWHHAQMFSGAPAPVPFVPGGGYTIPGYPFAPTPVMPAPAAAPAVNVSDPLFTPAHAQIKILVRIGGKFNRNSSSSPWDYEGGETRLVTIQSCSSFKELQHNLSSKMGHSIDQTCSLKYELPGMPEQLVDLKEDDDVDNMWDEWQTHRMILGKPNFKLRLFIQQDANKASEKRKSNDNVPGGKKEVGVAGNGSGGKLLGPLTPENSETSLTLQYTTSVELSPAASAALSDTLPRAESADSQESSAGSSASTKSARSLNATVGDIVAQYEKTNTVTHDSVGEVLAKLESKFELIPPEVLTIRRSLGDGTYGQAYLGRWLNVDVAVKCYNAELLNPPNWPGSAGMLAPRAFVDLVAEANMIAGLRHPNLIFAYGAVLPPIQEVIDCAEEVQKQVPGDTVTEFYMPVQQGQADKNVRELFNVHETITTAVAAAHAEAVVDGSAGDGNITNAASSARTKVASLLRAASREVVDGGNSAYRGTAVLSDYTTSESDSDGNGERGCYGINGMDLNDKGVPKVLRPPAIVVEYLTSHSLMSAIMKGEPFLKSPLVRLKLALDAARGMSYLHAKHLPHLDLKSANIIVGFRDRQPVAKVTDFGFLKQKVAAYSHRLLDLKNTMPWLPPELLEGGPESCSFSADVYSFGVVMWELWTRQLPYANVEVVQLYQMRCLDPDSRPPIPGEIDWVNDEVPAEPAAGWSGLMKECWATQPSARPTLQAVVDRLHMMGHVIKDQRRNAK